MNKEPIGFQMSQISRLFIKKVNESINESGINSTYFHILNYLEYNKNSEVTQKELCDFLKMKAPTISLALQNLEMEENIVRVKSSEDSRCTFVRITDKGRIIVEKVRTIFERTENLVSDCLSSEEAIIFNDCLEKIKRVLEMK